MLEQLPVARDHEPPNAAGSTRYCIILQAKA